MIKTSLSQSLIKILSQYPQYKLSLLITSLSLVVMLLAPESIKLLRYESNNVSDGELWRIITANFCHSNWNHWMLNIAGLWLMDIFYQPVLSQKIRAYLLLFCIVLNVLLLHWFMNLHWYVGLSGALHGFLIGGALLSWNNGKWINLSIIVFTVGKLIAESFWQINAETEKLINANVVEEAHSFGALSAFIFFILWYLLNLNSRNRKKG
ncbi:MAG: rhombosortase [Gammaproteobacteria bacterium]|nr:MAG: rhombosortase [Gammaproteobacteria bacterium]